MPEGLPGNSKHAAPKKNVKKVVSGTASERRPPLGKRFAETFVRGDATSVWSYVFWDVMLPRIQDTVVDMAQEGISRLIFGESRRGGRATTRSTNTYHDRYNPDAAMGKDRSSRVRTNHDFREVLIDSRVEAEEVLDTLTELVEKFGTATVADFKTMVGLEPEYTDQNWGWDSVRDATVRRAGNKYIIDIARPNPLD